MRLMLVSRAVLAALALLTSARVAHAHAILIDSQPAIRATLPPGPTRITLHFNSRIDRGRSVLTLLAPGAAPQRLPVGADSPADVMTTQATLVPGDDVVRWQVLAIDGHITRGDVPLTVTAPPAAQAATP